MTFETWLIYVGTLLVFFSTPGPSHLLMISVSMSNGFQRSLATAAGDLSANTLQIVAAGAGLATLVTITREGFAVIKWLGVAYLVWIGLRTIRASLRAHNNPEEAPRASVKSLWLRGFVTSAANPKAVVFFAALFPQFIDTGASLAPQIAILGVTYILVDGTFLVSYGRGASWIAEKISERYRARLELCGGAGLIGTAFLLSLRSNEG